MDGAILYPFIIWCLLALIITFRSGIGPTRKLLVWSAAALFAFFWQAELLTAVSGLMAGHWKPYLKGSLHTLFLSMVWLWPISLVYILFLASETEVRLILKILLFITLISWAGHIAALWLLK